MTGVPSLSNFARYPGWLNAGLAAAILSAGIGFGALLAPAGARASGSGCVVVAGQPDSDISSGPAGFAQTVKLFRTTSGGPINFLLRCGVGVTSAPTVTHDAGSDLAISSLGQPEFGSTRQPAEGSYWGYSVSPAWSGSSREQATMTVLTANGSSDYRLDLDPAFGPSTGSWRTTSCELVNGGSPIRGTHLPVTATPPTALYVWCPPSSTGTPSVEVLDPNAKLQMYGGVIPMQDEWIPSGWTALYGAGRFFNVNFKGFYRLGNVFEVRLTDPPGGSGSPAHQDYRLVVGMDPPAPTSVSGVTLQNPCGSAVTNFCSVFATSVKVGASSSEALRANSTATFINGPNGWTMNFHLGNRAKGVPGLRATENQVVEVEINARDFDPVAAVVYGASASSDLPVPNRTWKVDRVGSDNIITARFIPRLVGFKFNCGTSSTEACGGSDVFADRVGVFPSLEFMEMDTGFFAGFREKSRGLTVTTNAQEASLPFPVEDGRGIGVQTAGPHWLDSPDNTDWDYDVTGRRENEGFITLFLPSAIASDPTSFNLPLTEAGLSDLSVTRNGGAADMDAPVMSLVSEGGTVAGIYVDVPKFGYSAPTFNWKRRSVTPAPTPGGGSSGGGGSGASSPGGGPTGVVAPAPAIPAPVAIAAPSRPVGKVSVVSKKRSVEVVVGAEAGVTYSINAQNARKKKAKPKRGKCAAPKKGQVTCSVKLTKGSWRVSVEPSRSGVAGPSFTKTVKVK